MLVSGHNYKILLISTRMIYTKNIFMQKNIPLLKSKAESFVTREANSQFLGNTSSLCTDSLNRSIYSRTQRPFSRNWLLAEIFPQTIFVIIHVLPRQKLSRSLGIEVGSTQWVQLRWFVVLHCRMRQWEPVVWGCSWNQSETMNMSNLCQFIILAVLYGWETDPSGRAVYGVGLRLLASWDLGFESRWRHGCLSLVSVVCCQVEVSATGWSLVQRSRTECGVSSECDREPP